MRPISLRYVETRYDPNDETPGIYVVSFTEALQLPDAPPLMQVTGTSLQVANFSAHIYSAACRMMAKEGVTRCSVCHRLGRDGTRGFMCGEAFGPTKDAALCMGRMV